MIDAELINSFKRCHKCKWQKRVGSMYASELEKCIDGTCPACGQPSINDIHKSIEIGVFEALLKSTGDNKTMLIADGIAGARAKGYDAELEAALAQRFECPTCHIICNHAGLLIAPGHDIACAACGFEGIQAVLPGQWKLTHISGGKQFSEVQ
jgi:hypothetical protein